MKPANRQQCKVAIPAACITLADEVTFENKPFRACLCRRRVFYACAQGKNVYGLSKDLSKGETNS